MDCGVLLRSIARGIEKEGLGITAAGKDEGPGHVIFCALSSASKKEAGNKNNEESGKEAVRFQMHDRRRSGHHTSAPEVLKVDIGSMSKGKQDEGVRYR